MAQLVELRPHLDIYARETGNEGGGWKQRSWWSQKMTEETLWDMLDEVERGDRPGQWEGGGAESAGRD